MDSDWMTLSREQKRARRFEWYSSTNGIRFDSPEAEKAYRVRAQRMIDVYDVRGRRLRALVRTRVTPGRYVFDWDQTDDHGIAIGRGLYFVRLELAGRHDVRKIVAGRR